MKIDFFTKGCLAIIAVALSIIAVRPLFEPMVARAKEADEYQIRRIADAVERIQRDGLTIKSPWNEPFKVKMEK